MTYQLTVSKTQLRVIQQALELFERPFLGQTDYFLDHPIFDGDRRGTETLRVALRDALPPAKRNHGIHSPAVHDHARVAYDLQQVIRHQLWLDTHDVYRHVVSAQAARRSSSLELLAKIERVH